MTLATYPEGQQAIGMRVPWWTSVGVERRNLAVEGEVIALGRTGIGGLTVAVSQARDEILATTMRLFWVKLGLGTAVLVGAALTAWLLAK